MKEQEEIRARAETVLKLSRAMLCAASQGRLDDMERLANRRADMIERMFGAGEVTGDNRVFLAGIMEHVRRVDAATRECLDRDHEGLGMAMEGAEADDGASGFPSGAVPRAELFGLPRNSRF